MNVEEIVQRVVNAEAKAGLRSTIIFRDLDICCFQGHYISNITASKVQIQKITAKDFSRPKEPKTKKIKSVCTNATKPSK